MLFLLAIPFLLWYTIKFYFWSGVYPPKDGWSTRQLKRMRKDLSPWTFWTWINYYKDISNDRI